MIYEYWNRESYLLLMGIGGIVHSHGGGQVYDRRLDYGITSGAGVNGVVLGAGAGQGHLARGGGHSGGCGGGSCHEGHSIGMEFSVHVVLA